MASTEAGIDEEFRLAQQLKNSCCEPNDGKTWKEADETKAAEFFHKIGLIYRRRSPHKISLIKSAGLLNAAIVRKPSNVSQIKSDLSELCQHILKLAQAVIEEDLVKAAEEVKTSITKLREDVKASLHKKVPKLKTKHTVDEFRKYYSDKIRAIRDINCTVATFYTNVMAELSQLCKDIMGEPPCEYAIVGMGSLAREEITPYSDFEHIILLSDDKNYKSHLEYFRWYSVIFHIIILNLQETIIPSLNIYSLNDKESSSGDWFYDHVTPRGISFDGMMPHACKFPLGRQQHTKNKLFTTELIKPVSEMLEYLSSDADLKNGYHLADILTKTCFVFGNKDIFKQFETETQTYLNTKSKTDAIADVKNIVKEDLNSFSTRFQLNRLKLKNKINIKQLLYRSTTIFIATMARVHNITAKSCFDIIDEMAKFNIITQNTAEKLHCGIAIACEIRLRVYLDKNSQCDNAIDLKQDGIETFLDIVGVATTIYYFQIAYCLQCEVAKQLNFTKLHFYSDPKLINIMIGLVFGVKKLPHFSKDVHIRLWNLNSYEFDKCIKQLEAEINCNTLHLQNIADSPKPNTKQIELIADCLYSAKLFDEAIDFYKKLLEIHQDNSQSDVAWNDFTRVNRQIGHCYLSLNQPAKSLNFLSKAFEIQSAMPNADLDKEYVELLDNIGSCHMSLHNYPRALETLNQSLKIKQNLSLDVFTDRDIACTNYKIGRCHNFLKHFEAALRHLNNAIEIFQYSSLEAHYDLAMALKEIGQIQKNLQQLDNALDHLNRALEIENSNAVNVDMDRNIAKTIHEIGCTQIEMHNYNDALSSLHNALTIKQNITLEADTDRGIASTLLQIGYCHSNLQEPEKALKQFSHALKIYEAAALDPGVDGGIALTTHEIGRCHIVLKQNDNALSNLYRALQIRHNATLNPNEDIHIAAVRLDIGVCYVNSHENTKALKFLKEALEIYQNPNVTADTSTNIAKVCHEISRSHINLEQYNLALNHLYRALEISQSKKIKSLLHSLSHTKACMELPEPILMPSRLNCTTLAKQTSQLRQAADRNMSDWTKSAAKPQTFHDHDTHWSVVKQSTYFTADSGREIASTTHEIGRCHANLHNYELAFHNLQSSLELKKEMSTNADIDENIASTLFVIGQCHFGLNQYELALSYLTRSLKIRQNTTPNAEKDRDIATILQQIGRCHLKLDQKDVAIVLLNQALEIFLRSKEIAK